MHEPLQPVGAYDAETIRAVAKAYRARYAECWPGEDCHHAAQEAAELAYRDRHPGCTWAEATQEVLPMIAIVSSQYSAWFWEPVKVKQRAAGIEV